MKIIYKAKYVYKDSSNTKNKVLFYSRTLLKRTMLHALGLSNAPKHTFLQNTSNINIYT